MIAYDSRSVIGTYVNDDDIDKKIVKGDLIMFCCGCLEYASGLAQWLQSGSQDMPENAEIEAFIYDGKELFRAGHAPKEGFHWNAMSLGKHYATGSGVDHAITAMDMGADAKTAVKMAMKRDVGTGGRIRTFKINGKR